MIQQPPRIHIVTPYLAQANNGNWRTAKRWADMLSNKFRTALRLAWDGDACECIIALHARRSAPSIAAWAKAGKPMPLALCLTGTDLYNDLPHDASAAQSVDLADRLIVLQEDALRYVPVRHRAKTQVVHQSSPTLRPASKRADRLDCVMVGHIRAEKDPLTVVRALRLLPTELPVRVQHIGAELDPDLARALDNEASDEPRYRRIGSLPHGLTRAAIKRAHLLLHPSLLEGGANVIVEALTSGTQVLASEMSGNVGMLGQSYPGYFPPGDAKALAALLKRWLADAHFRARLADACRARESLFSPAEEQRRLEVLVFNLLADSFASG